MPYSAIPIPTANLGSNPDSAPVKMKMNDNVPKKRLKTSFLWNRFPVKR